MNYDDHADEEWVEDDDATGGDDLLICPSCSTPVHEETQQCPACGDWITPVWPGQDSRKTIWLLAVGLVIVSLLMMTIW